MNLTSDEVLNI